LYKVISESKYTRSGHVQDGYRTLPFPEIDLSKKGNFVVL